MYNVIAYQIANTIDIKQCKTYLNWKLLFSNSDELFYKFSEDKYVYLFQYGTMSFFNLSDFEINDIFTQLKPFCKDDVSDRMSEEMKVTIQPNTLKVEFDQIILPQVNEEMIRLIMLNTSQSVALSGYSLITEMLLIETNGHTKYLENKGKLNISGHKLKRFIGKILNIKNKIYENLYIFDSPEITWEDEQLNKLNAELKQTFDLKDRYHLIHDRIDIIKENLELFKDIMDHKESSRLEWIIIILIVIEVLDMLILKFS
jgi:uncharacterized Rmd1/YagE family protein